MRLDKYLCKSTDLTKSEAVERIQNGEVNVNSETVTDESTQVHENNTVLLNDKRLTARPFRYLLMNKPAGTVCSNIDEVYPSLFRYLDIENVSELHIAGRLDADTTGLVLITSDGDWSHKITSPRHQKYKVYLIETEQPITDEMCEQLTDGVMLHGEKSATKPAIVEKIADYSMRLSIYEGKYHQVKRMLAAVDNRVVALHREKIGTVALDPNLAPGEYRPLTQHEIETISS